MSGKGKYTVYVPKKSARRTFFEKLFAGDQTHTPPFYGEDEVQALKDADAAGNDLLRAKATNGIQAGDPGFFPQGVDMTYQGATSAIKAPDTAEGKDVTWKKAGDPANSFVPDITSPGPGKTDGLDKANDPKITVADLKPNYVPGAPNTGTKAPTTVGSKVFVASELGADLKLGDSGGNT